MKKGLLSLCACMVMFVANAQITFTSTSASFSGNSVPPGTSAGTFYSYQPGAGYSGSYFCDASCSTPISAANCAFGGWDPNVQSGSAQTNPINGVVFWGGSLRAVYASGPSGCVIQPANFGFHTGTSAGGATSGAALDLSLAANNKIQFTYRTDANATLYLQLWNPADYNDKLANASIALTGDGNEHVATLDFSTDWVAGAVKTDVKQVALQILSTTPSPSTTRFVLNNITIGSSVPATTSTTAIEAASNVNTNSLYPNPASDNVVLELELKSAADVKVVIADQSGKEIKTILETGASSFSRTIDVSTLHKGIYVVSYYLNGSPAANKLLMVK